MPSSMDELAPIVVDDAHAVREHQAGRQPTFIHQPFKLKITFLHGSVCLRLIARITNEQNDTFPVYLQVTPDHLHSLRPLYYKSDDVSLVSEMVMWRSGSKSDMSGLRFKLHSGSRAQLIVPMDFGGRETLGVSNQRYFDSLASLAVASSFSVYFPHNTVSKSRLDKCCDTAKCFSKLAEDKQQLRLFELNVGPQRLYNGKGGMVVHPGDRNAFQPDGERDRSTTPATTGSCATTNDYEDDPRYLDSPPRYDGRLGAGQKPTTTSDEVSNPLESPAVGCAPPDYSATECPPDVSRPKRVFCGDDNPRESFKKVCSIAPIPMLASTGDVQQLDIKSASDLEEANSTNTLIHCLRLQLTQQGQLIQKQGKEIEILQRRNTELESRLQAVEEACVGLQAQQEDTRDEVESLTIHVDELEEGCIKLEKGMPDRWDEGRDWLDENWGGLAEYLKQRMDEASREFLRETVAAEFATYTAKVCKALQA